jgi:1-acyl-sn-glycerol-3-phosphate acyltransferase
MLRKLWYPIALFFLTVWYGSKAVVFGLLGIPNRQGGVYDRIGRTWSAKVLKVAGVTVETQGMERVPRDQPVVFVSNHQSFFDILALSSKLPGTYEEAAQAVRDGMCAVVFAEGTRSRTGDLLPFKKGPFVFAIASQVPLVPIYCAGTFDILPKGSIWVRPKPVTLMFGEPMSTKGLTYEDRQKLMAEARTVIERLRSEAGE